MYSEMIKVQVGPAVKAVYPAGDAIFQDDGATIHRAGVALQAVKETFNHRLEPKDQANKMADVWPIENIWSIVKTKLDEEEYNTLDELKSAIKKIWKELNKDKDLLQRMMESIPKRLEAVIKREGEQIHKSDY